MKVTDPDVIKTGERDLIESIKADLDLSAIQKILFDKIKSSSMSIKDNKISFDVKGGEIVVHDGQIAFRIDFQLKTDMAITFDRKGNYISDENHGPYDVNHGIDQSADQIKKNDLSDESISDNMQDRLEKSASLQEPEYANTSGKSEKDTVESALEEDYINPDPEETDIIFGLQGDNFDAGEPSKESDLYEAPDKLDSEELLDDIEALEDEDILGDLSDDEALADLDPIADLNGDAQDDDFEELLKESRQFWGNQEK